MGTVFGVYLKYVALSTMGFGAAYKHLTDDYEITAAAAFFLYMGVANGIISALFFLQKGMWVLGKDEKTGKIPLWSHVVWFGFHLPTQLYTFVHHYVLGHLFMVGAVVDAKTGKTTALPAATEVVPGWYIGGKYSDELRMFKWGAIVDLTVEFNEACIGECAVGGYKLVRCWDGVPPTPDQLEDAAVHCANAYHTAKVMGRRTPVLIHCAHGRGRSTTSMCAALVRAGLFDSWEAAFEACKKERPVVKLNGKMRKALTDWFSKYGKEE
mmetsp:Transcript_77068/g.150970  ORF Transcript_77068/g.150970 Transcript_77068/m.150970 type:complete len:268 (-) Transcript_77068:271-1074(-)